MSTVEAGVRASKGGVERAGAQTSQFLTFMLAGEEYGVDILRVQEIKGWDKVTRIPNTPHYVLGVINLRGAVVPIIDLRRRFGLEMIDFGPTTVIIVVRVGDASEQRTVGMVVDAVSEVYDVDMDNTRPPPEICGSVDTVFVKALVTVAEKMLILLDMDRLIGNCVLEQSAAGVAAA